MSLAANLEGKLVAVDEVRQPFLGGKGVVISVERWIDRFVVHYALDDIDRRVMLRVTDEAGADYTGGITRHGRPGHVHCMTDFFPALPASSGILLLTFLTDQFKQLDEVRVELRGLA